MGKCGQFFVVEPFFLSVYIFSRRRCRSSVNVFGRICRCCWREREKKYPTKMKKKENKNEIRGENRFSLKKTTTISLLYQDTKYKRMWPPHVLTPFLYSSTLFKTIFVWFISIYCFSLVVYLPIIVWHSI